MSLTEKAGEHAFNAQTVHRSGAAAAHKAAAKAHKAAAAKLRGLDELRDARDISQQTRDELDAKDFAGPNESFPIIKPEDVEAAAHALGRAKGDRAAIKRRIVAIAYRKGNSFVERLPEDWKRKTDMKAASAFARMMDFARGFFKSAQDADQMSSKDLNDSLTDALREAEGNYVYVEAFYPVTDPTHVAYTVFGPGVDGDCCYERPFTLSDAGVVTLGGTRIEVMRVVTYEPADGAEPEHDSDAARNEYNRAIAGLQNPGEGDPGSEESESPETLTNKESDMKREDVVKALEKATDCQLASIAKVLEGKTEEPKQPTEAELKAAQEAAAAQRKSEIDAAIAAAFKNLTFEQVLEKASADVRAAISAGSTQAAEKKAASVKALVASGRGVFSEDDLKAMSQAELDRLVKLADIKTVDYAVGAPRAASTQTDKVAAPPDLTAALRAARGQK